MQTLPAVLHWAASRAKVYIGRRTYFEQLDAHVAGNNPPLILLGESGSGKSALLSNWTLQYREQHPDDFLLLHFIGSSQDSANATRLLRRIMLELKDELKLPDDVPSAPNEIHEAFPGWLVQTAGHARIVRRLIVAASSIGLATDIYRSTASAPRDEARRQTTQAFQSPYC